MTSQQPQPAFTIELNAYDLESLHHMIVTVVHDMSSPDQAQAIRIDEVNFAAEIDIVALHNLPLHVH